jgi:hypothetical protein
MALLTVRRFFILLFLSLAFVNVLGVDVSRLSCIHNGLHNITQPTKCEAAIHYPLDLQSSCYDGDITIRWYIYIDGWIYLGDYTDGKSTLRISGSNFTEEGQDIYRCRCGNLSSYFLVKIKEGEPVTPHVPFEKKVGEEYFLSPLSPQLEVQDRGRVCIHATSSGWPTPKYAWYRAKVVNSSDVLYLPVDDKSFDDARCYSGDSERQAAETLCIFPTLRQLSTPYDSVHLKCVVENIVSSITFEVNVTFPELSSGETPNWFLKPHESQSFGQVSVNETGVGTGYCVAYTDEANATVEYEVCVLDLPEDQQDLSACYLEPKSTYSKFRCYQCFPQGHLSEVDLEQVTLPNHVGMVTSGCRVTSHNTQHMYGCMARRVNHATQTTSDFQMIGRFNFVLTPDPTSNPVIVNSECTNDMIIVASVAFILFLLTCCLCCLCTCCCCYYRHRYKSNKAHVRVQEDDDDRLPNEQPPPLVEPVRIPGTPGQVEQVQVPAAGENDDDVEQFEVDQVMDEGERLLEDRRQRDSEDPTTGYGSTDSRPRPPSMPGRTWPRASEPKDMKVTLVDTVDGSKVAEVNMGLPGDNVMNTPVIYLPTNRKYEFQISTARKTITVFTGQPVPVFARRRSNKPYNMARDLTIPSAIDEMLPVNITELVHFVPRIAHKWSEIGTYLNMLAKVRELTDAPGSTHVKMSVILDSWIESGKDVSWRVFVEVLDKPGVDLGAVGVDVKQYLYEKVPIVPDNIDFLQPLNIESLLHLVPKFAPHWEKVGTQLKFTQKVKELKHPSCRLSEVVKMTAIFDEWSRVHGRDVSWLDLVDALEEDEDLAWLKGYVGQHLQAKLIRQERRD